MRRKIFLPLIAIMLLISGCGMKPDGGSGKANDEGHIGPPLSGVIVESSTERKSILFQEDGQAQPNYSFSFESQAVLEFADGRSADYEDIAVDQKVRIWTTGVVAESFPMQATIRKLIID